MGRPLNKKYFGNPATAIPLTLQFTSCWIPGEAGPVSNAYVVKQVGGRRYLAMNPTSGVSGVVVLAPAADIAGHATFAVTTTITNATTQHAYRITSARVVTFEGAHFSWKADGTAPDATYAVLPLV